MLRAQSAPGPEPSRLRAVGALDARIRFSAAPCYPRAVCSARVTATVSGIRTGSVAQSGGAARGRGDAMGWRFPWNSGRWCRSDSTNVMSITPTSWPSGWIRIRCVCRFPPWEGPPFHLSLASPFQAAKLRGNGDCKTEAQALSMNFRARLDCVFPQSGLRFSFHAACLPHRAPRAKPLHHCRSATRPPRREGM